VSHESESPHVVVQSLFPDTELPQRQTAGSAGLDLHAHLRGRTVRVIRSSDGTISEQNLPDSSQVRLWLPPGSRALVPTGFRMRLPVGYEAQVRSRSSMAFKRGLVVWNQPGTIDADFPGEVLVMLANTGEGEQWVEHGERVAQMVLARYETLPWVGGEVGVSSNRTGGIGSTGA
jgi:dUTP pyrophosphatase